MTRAAMWRFFFLLVLVACGRTQPVRYFVDGGEFEPPFDAGPEDPDGGQVPCREGRFALTPAQPVVMLVLDRSESMVDRFGDAGISKWNALRSALRDVLPIIEGQMELGALLYPVGGSGSCSAPLGPVVAAMPIASNAIVTRLDATNPTGGTPTSPAIDAAVAALRQRRTAGNARALVLATDGVPTCNSNLNPRTCICTRSPCFVSTQCLDEARTLTSLTNALVSGVPTYVIGIQGVADQVFTSTLNNLAVAGGRARPGAQRYFAATSAQELGEAFSQVASQVASCTYLTTSVPDSDQGLELTLAGVEVEFDPNGASGWSWSDRRNGELVLRGDACAQAMGRTDQLQVVVKCQP